MLIIFDNDAASDDAAALMYLLIHPGIEIKAITVTGVGLAHGEAGAKNFSHLCFECGKPKIPVAYGRAEPLSAIYAKPFPDFLRDAMDDLLKVNQVTLQKDTVIQNSAVKLIHDTLLASKEKITILVTGPLTNIAECLQYHFDLLKEKVERIVIMGGAINVRGNINELDSNIDNDVAEWNILADPYAAQIVFNAQIPITLVPLDATNQVPLTLDFYQSLEKEKNNNLQAKFIFEWLQDVISVQGMEYFLNHFYLWDQLAAMVCVNPDIAIVTPMLLTVNLNNANIERQLAGQSEFFVDVVTMIKQPQAVLNDFLQHILQYGHPVLRKGDREK